MFFSSVRKHPFLLALRRWGRFAFPPRETAPAATSEEPERMISQASFFPRGNDLGSGVEWIVPVCIHDIWEIIMVLPPS